MDLYGSEYYPIESCCEQNIEPSGTKRVTESIDYMND